MKPCIFSRVGNCSFAHSLVTLSLINAHFKDQLWAIRSLKMSDVSDLFVWTLFPFFYAQEPIGAPIALRSFALYQRVTWVTLYKSPPIPLYKRATVNNSLRSLMIKEQRERFTTIHSFSQANHSFAPLHTKNKRIDQKTNERIPNPEI